jgi:hypothetical protein
VGELLGRRGGMIWAVSWALCATVALQYNA